MAEGWECFRRPDCLEVPDGPAVAEGPAAAEARECFRRPDRSEVLCDAEGWEDPRCWDRPAVAPPLGADLDIPQPIIDDFCGLKSLNVKARQVGENTQRF